MKIAASSTGTDLDAQVDPRFGRCQNFLIVDIDTMEFEVVTNQGAASSGGSGIAAAQQVIDKGLAAVLTGNCGPNAYDVLAAAGIEIFTGVSGTIKDAIESYGAGKLQPSIQPNVSPHSGTGRGRGMR